MNIARPSVVLISLTAESLGLQAHTSESSNVVSKAVETIEALASKMIELNKATIIVETIVSPSYGPMGNADLWAGTSSRFLIEQVNIGIRKSAGEGRFVLLDVAALASAVGLEAWRDPILWNHAKTAVAFRFLPLYCEHIVRIINAAVGRSRRCLVLDLDNTLWGGAVGDDGIDGVVLGEGNARGEAFLDVQRTAMELRAGGILLAVVSKNEQETALNVLRNHSEMLVRPEHLAAFAINWQDKSTNLQKLSAELNLGLESFVFLDDNPAERAHVRSCLPMVAVPEVGDDPAFYSRILLAAGYFERTRLSAEDVTRSEMYRTEQQRSANRAEYNSVESYLRSLNMELACERIDAANLSRVAQLINKTNQFNLTTHRRTEEEVRTIATRNDYFTLAVKLSDRFGSLGLVGVVICRVWEQNLEIENFLLSCRVLGRGVEEAMMNEMMTFASSIDVASVRGAYIDSGRNQVVRDLYPRLGFKHFASSDGPRVEWQMRTSDYKAIAHSLTLMRSADYTISV